ncbi:MAG: HAD family phosphatase [Candidatus Krumholzibacteriota bacterium]|nr:HAD family phosphatase [Candidatus Krumholzibacteriota bacterium]
MSKLQLLKSILEDSRAVIFDFDNVIVDSEPYHYRAYATVFASHGHRLDRDEYWVEWTSRGGGAEGEISRYGLDLDPIQIRKEKDPIYSRFCRGGKIPAFPLALKIIRSFHRAGFSLVIASGSYQRDIRAIISSLGIESYFKAVIGKDGIEKTKPHPETYLRAVARTGFKAHQCFAIEDAEKGISSAQAAGLKVIVIETGITRGFKLERADLRLSGQEELYLLLQEAGLRP